MSGAELPLRAGQLTIAELIDLYFAHYDGRDTTRVQRLTWWKERLGSEQLDQVNDDHIHAALESLARNPPRRWAGVDVDGRPIFKAKREQLAPATINRYSAAIAAAFSWAINQRIAPKRWDHPCRRVKRRTENNGHTRFLTADECRRLLDACKESPWPRLYLLVLLAVTTGARKSELMGLRWRDVDLVQCVMHVARTKNGDPKVLPLTPAAAEQLEKLQGAAASHVFASMQMPDRPYSFEGRWAEALKEAKIRGFRFHDLRHSCASFLVQKGATLVAVADLLGHRQISMTQRYSHLSSCDRSAMVNRVLGDLR